ncbi:hypothetical protein [Mycobacteroides abscessus]|nr:hypothetical protein [Mycobacteroides abscessus]
MGSVKLDFTEASWPSEGVDIEVDVDRLSGWRPRGGHSSLSLSM